MISKTTKVVNNKFQVTFNFTPDNIKHSRKNSKGTYTATHVGGGTTARKGIWEGIEIVEVKTKIGSGAWRSHGTNKTVTVETSSNDVTIQAQAKYRLKSMGWHWNDFTGTYPFFWYGNIKNVPYKYRLGSFRDSYPKTPGSEHHICAVPPDWKYVSCQWSNWAYKHGQDTPNWEFSNGKYEQRNGNYEAAKASNGWISDNNLKQMYRKSMMFIFEKTYSNSVISSGISTHPNTPNLEVHWAKGDQGQVTVKYTDNAGIAGKILLKAYCNNKTVEVLNFNNSWTFYNGQSRTIDVNFYNAFGEAYRGNNVYYEAWSMNNLGYQSKSSTGWVGVQRYNGRPSIPTGLRIESDNGIIYNKIRFAWNKASDPDNDTVVYDLWIRLTTKEGQILKNDYIARGLNALSMNYDISNLPDNCNIQIWVRSSDNSIVSDWCIPVECKKGAVPKGTLTLIAPNVSGSNLYNNRPRFFFDGYDKESIFVFVYGDKEYSTDKHPNMFSISDSKIVFKPNFNMEQNKQFSCYGYMKNKYGNSKKTPVCKFTIKDPYENITEGNFIEASVVNEVYSLIKDFGKAYKRDFTSTISKGEFLTVDTFNICNKFLKDTASYLNGIVKTDTFDYIYDLANVVSGQINDDALWDELVKKLNYI